jgi:hypothetical protein
MVQSQDSDKQLVARAPSCHSDCRLPVAAARRLGAGPCWRLMPQSPPRQTTQQLIPPPPPPFSLTPSFFFLCPCSFRTQATSRSRKEAGGRSLLEADATTQATASHPSTHTQNLIPVSACAPSPPRALTQATSRRRKEAGGRTLLDADAAEPANAEHPTTHPKLPLLPHTLFLFLCPCSSVHRLPPAVARRQGAGPC